MSKKRKNKNKWQQQPVIFSDKIVLLAATKPMPAPKVFQFYEEVDEPWEPNRRSSFDVTGRSQYPERDAADAEMLRWAESGGGERPPFSYDG